jgi:hypothetical protein
MLDIQERPNAADAAMVAFAAREAEMILAAKRSVIRAVKMRAKRYLDNPESRDALVPGLWCASPKTLIATGKTMLENELRFPRRRSGFSGETLAINARALMLVGRYGRRWWHRIERGVA